MNFFPIPSDEKTEDLGNIWWDLVPGQFFFLMPQWGPVPTSSRSPCPGQYLGSEFQRLKGWVEGVQISFFFTMKVKKDEKNTRIEKIPQIDYNSIAMIKTNTDIQQIHDKFFHKIFDSLENARDFLEKVLPIGLKKRLNLTYIEIEDTKYVSNEFEEGFSDIVVKTKLATKKDEKIPVDIYFLTEHKSEGSVKLFIQCLKYMVFEWEKDYNAGKKPRPIIPVVFYHGAKKWGVPKEFAEQYEVDEEIKPYLLNYQYFLFDTIPWNFQDKSNQDIKENVFLYTAMVLMKVAYTNDIEAIREIFRYWHEKGSTENKDVILFFMRYISQTQDIRPDRLKEMLDKSKIDGGELMPTLAQQFKEEFMETLGPQLKEEGIKIGVKKGVKKGVEKGVEKGEKNKAIETAKKMINKGFDIDTIVELTGLGKEEVNKLSH